MFSQVSWCLWTCIASNTEQLHFRRFLTTSSQSKWIIFTTMVTEDRLLSDSTHLVGPSSSVALRLLSLMLQKIYKPTVPFLNFITQVIQIRLAKKHHFHSLWRMEAVDYMSADNWIWATIFYTFSATVYLIFNVPQVQKTYGINAAYFVCVAECLVWCWRK